MAPGGRWRIFGQRAGEVDAVDAFCVTSSGSAEEIRGFVLRIDKAHRVPEKLGDVVEKLLHQRGLPVWFGALCRPDSMVGSRICHVSAPGLRDRFYQREGLICQKAPAGDKLRDLLCSVAGLGHLPLVGATGASFVTCLLALALMPLFSPDAWKFFMLAIAVAASVICALLEKWSHRHYLAEDPREVVLDEVAGMALALRCIFCFPLFRHLQTGDSLDRGTRLARGHCLGRPVGWPLCRRGGDHSWPPHFLHFFLK